MANKKTSVQNIKLEDLENLVVDLSKQGLTPAKIGLVLRDQHGIPKAKIAGKKITKILKEKNISFNTDLDNIQARIDNLKTHLSKNKHDYPASRAITKKLWAVSRISKQA